MAEKIKKCSKKAFCWAMDKHLLPANDHGRGMAAMVVTKLSGKDAGAQRTVGVGYRTHLGHKPTMFNHCPWCGEKILWEKETS